MEMFSLIAALLQSLATVARNPALGLGGRDVEKYATLVDLLAGLVGQGTAALTDLKALQAEVEAMVATGTGPTDVQLATWKARSDAAHAGLQALKDP